MRLRARLFQTGDWMDSCEVRCDCGWSVWVASGDDGQRLAWQHDKEHEQTERKAQGDGDDRPLHDDAA